MATTQELQSQLDEAKAARHALLVGAQLVSVGYGANSVQYSKSSLPELVRYIRELQAQIDGKSVPRTRIRYAVPD